MTRKEIYDIITDENKTDEEKLDILESEEEELLLDAVYSLFDMISVPRGTVIISSAHKPRTATR